MGAAVRQSVSWKLVLTLAMVLALIAALAPAQSAVAQEADDETVQPEADPRLSIADFPGSVGQLVRNLGDNRVPTLRYRGHQRFDTARMIALDAFENPDDVIIARGDLFPDALSGSYLAGQREAPLLLTSSHRLEPDTLEALEELNPRRVTLVGGTAAIASSVAAELGQQGYPTNRIGGFDRFETAKMIATADGTTAGEREDHGRTAIVARADEFADALVAGTLSYTAKYPLLLTTHDGLHSDAADALAELRIDHVIVPGGTAAVDQGTVAEMESMGIDVQRVSGVDRVATSVEFAQFMREELGFGLKRINTAIGTRFPDALALGPLSGDRGQPIVLTANENTLGGDGAVEEFLSQTCSIDVAGLGGGHRAITAALEDHMRDIATSTGAPCMLNLLPDLAFRDLGGEHTLDSKVTDNARTPVAGEDVRVEVYRATDLQLPDVDIDDAVQDLDLSGGDSLRSPAELEDILAEVEEALGNEFNLDDLAFDNEPAERFVETTDENGEIDVTYTGPATPALDISIACLDAESDSCALLSGGLPEPDSELLTASAVTVWGVGALDANLLLVEPPLAIETSGTDPHEVTATALLADLGAVGDLDVVGDISNPAELLDALLHPDNLDLDNLLGGISSIGVDPDLIGQRVGGTEVRFEVYRATDLLEDLLGDALGDPTGVEDLLGSLDASVIESLLSDLDAGALLDILNVAPIATGTDVTDSLGEATFDYDGPNATLPGIDVIVACFGGDDDNCVPLVNGDLDLPTDPGIGIAGALWLPGVLDSLDPVADLGLLGGGDLLAGTFGTASVQNASTAETQSSDGPSHELQASATRLDGEAPAGAPVRWDVYRADVGLLEGILEDLVGVVDESTLEDALAGIDTEADLVGAVVELLTELDETELLEVLDPETLLTDVAAHQTGGVETADENGNADIVYDGPDSSALDLIVSCVGTEQSDCATLGLDGLTLNHGNLQTSLVATKLWLGTDVVDATLVESIVESVLGIDLDDLLGGTLLESTEEDLQEAVDEVNDTIDDTTNTIDDTVDDTTSGLT